MTKAAKLAELAEAAEAHAAEQMLATFDPAPRTETALECLTPIQLEDKQLCTVVKSIGRPPPFNGRGTFVAEHKAWVCAFLYAIPSPGMAASIMGCSIDNFYHHRRNDEDFKREWDEAIKSGFQQIVGAAAENALGVGDPDVLSRRSEKLLGAFLLRESRVKHDVEHKHGGGIVLMPAPMTEEEWEKHVFEQQQVHRLQSDSPVSELAKRQPVIIEHEPHDTGPTPPDVSQPTPTRHAADGAITLQSDEERESAIASGEARDLIDRHTTRRGGNRIVRSY